MLFLLQNFISIPFLQKELAKTDSSLQDSNAVTTADKDGERTGSPAGNTTLGPPEGNAVDSQQNNDQQNTRADNLDSGKGSVGSGGDNQGSGEGDIGTEDSSQQRDHKDINGESDVAPQRGNEGSIVEPQASINPQGANTTPQGGNEGAIGDNAEQREETLSPSGGKEGTNKETEDGTSSTTDVKEDQHQTKDKAVNQQTKKGDDPASLVTTETSEDTETDRDKGKDEITESLRVISHTAINSSIDTVTSDTANEPSEKEDTRGRSPSSRARSKNQTNHTRRRERRKKKHSSPAPQLRKKTSKVGNAAEHYLQSILLSYFQAFDQNNIGLVSHDDFWNVRK